jgi:hypothetical protein
MAIRGETCGMKNLFLRLKAKSFSYNYSIQINIIVPKMVFDEDITSMKLLNKENKSFTTL